MLKQMGYTMTSLTIVTNLQESEAVREETTRQLNRAVVDDWNYQTSFKQKREEEDKLAELSAAYQEKQVSDL